MDREMTDPWDRDRASPDEWGPLGWDREPRAEDLLDARVSEPAAMPAARPQGVGHEPRP